MGMLRRFDAWAGLKLFHPPIIRFCQWTGYTQYRLHRDMWFAFGLWASWDSAQEGLPWWLVALFLLACAFMGLRAAILPAEHAETQSPRLRAFMWLVLILSLPSVVADPWRLLDNVWLLFAEYAVTIANIPPREKRGARALREAREAA